MLCTIDEFPWEALAITVSRRLNAMDVIGVWPISLRLAACRRTSALTGDRSSSPGP